MFFISQKQIRNYCMPFCKLRQCSFRQLELKGNSINDYNSSNTCCHYLQLPFDSIRENPVCLQLYDLNLRLQTSDYKPLTTKPRRSLRIIKTDNFLL